MTLSRKALLYLALFLSGAAGLIYEVTWLKALGLVFGSTTDALTTVLAAFMGGLGLGSWALGRRADRHPQPLQLYCYLEIGVAATALLTFTVLPSLRQFYSVAGGGIALRILCAALLLLAPTFLMGATFPVLVGIFRQGQTETGGPVSRMYAINTAGAVAGTFGAGFLLLPSLGVTRTAVAAAACNTLAAVLAMIANVGAPDRETVEPAPSTETQQGSLLLLCLSALSGATAMVLEVAWTRLLAAPLGGSTYAFSVMLAAFLIGIAGGSRIYPVFAWFGATGRGTLAFLQFAIAATGALALALWRWLPMLVFTLLKSYGATFFGLAAVQFAGALFILLLPAIFYGLNFPCLSALYAPDENKAAGQMGRLYAVNTMGAIAGSLVGGLYLVPSFGSYSALAAAMALSFASGIALVSGGKRLVAAGGFAILLAATVPTGLFSHSSLDQEGVVAAYFHGGYYQSKLTLNEIVETRDYLFIEDGKNATVSVFAEEGQRALRVNGKVDASMGDMRTQVMLGVLPLAMHQAPRRVLVIGFGSGVTAHMAAIWPGVERVDVVEIEPAVIHAARYLKEMNQGVYQDPKVRMILDDARHFLFTTRERYDVVISEPSNPWMAGVGNLFTAEFYREANSRLAEGGIFGQWVQTYQFLPEDFALVTRTLAQIFPHQSLWRAEIVDFLLVGSRTPVWPVTEQYKAAFQKAGDLRTILWQVAGMDRPEGIWAYFRLDPRDLRGLAGIGPVNTDDRPVLEYQAGLRLARPADDYLRRMVALAQTTHPIKLTPEERLAVASTALRIGDVQASSVAAQPLSGELPDSAEFWLYVGDWTRAQRNPSGAAVAYQRAIEKGAGWRARAGLAVVSLEAQKPEAEELLRNAALSFNDPSPAGELARTEVMVVLAQLLGRNNRFDEAIEWQKKVIAAGGPDRFMHLHWAQLADFYKKKGDRSAAKQALEKSLELDHYGQSAHLMLGEIYLDLGQNQEAAEQFRSLLRFHPLIDLAAYERAAEAVRRAGYLRESSRILARGRELFAAPPSR